MIKAAFFDVDGTLVSHKTRSVPQSARQAIAKLQSAGIQCIVATGRHIRELKKLPAGDIPFDAYITLNGQLILDEKLQRLYGIPVTGPAKDILLRMFTNRELPALIVEEEENYVNYVDARVEEVHREISTPLPRVAPYSGEDIYQVCVYLTKENEEPLEELEGLCVMARWGFGGLDIIARGGGKMTGIQWYLERCGIDPAETIAFGDAENDIDMLRLAGIGVAMGNAGEAVKQAADYVTTDIDDDGIANALKHFGLIETPKA
jgi:Cof subfamily protein (haloacid dehalogenase superfamily)